MGLHSAGDVSPLAALLLPQILPVFSVVAPGQQGASPPSVLRPIHEMRSNHAVNRAARRERLTVVVHAMTAVGLISQALGNAGDPSTPRLLVALPLIGGGLAIGSVVRHRRGHAPSSAADIA